MLQHITRDLLWRQGRQAMMAMKEKVATRMAAHDSMKKMWLLPAIKTEKQHFTSECDTFRKSHSETTF